MDFKSASDVISSIAFSPDGKAIAAGTNAGNIRIWDFETGKLLKRIPDFRYPITELEFTENGKRLVSASDEKNYVRVWRSGL